MDNAHYLEVITDAFEKLENLQRQRESIEAETMKLEQLVTATANMLPDDMKNLILRRMAIMQELLELREGGLTDTIRAILMESAGEWLTVTNVRDCLEKAGFDFSTYTSSPLASISTTLRRMKSGDVETKSIDGVTAYRWKETQGFNKAAFAAAALKAASANTMPPATLPKEWIKK